MSDIIERLERLQTRLSLRGDDGVEDPEAAEIEDIVRELQTPDVLKVVAVETRGDTGKAIEREVTFRGQMVKGVVSVGWHLEDPHAHPIVTLRLANCDLDISQLPR